ncbi:hypothetical protein LCGC14_1866940, partial [marine sediment metagenome]
MGAGEERTQHDKHGPVERRQYDGEYYNQKGKVMRMSEAYPSKYLKAQDLKGQRVMVTISHVTMEDIGDESKSESKPVVFFQGKDKGMVLNKTNAAQISFMYGDESDSWCDKKIELFTMMVAFQGQQVPAIRIAPPPNVPMTGQPMP